MNMESKEILMADWDLHNYDWLYFPINDRQKLAITNMAVVESIAYDNLDYTRTILISIRSVNGDQAEVRAPFQDKLFIAFDDVEFAKHGKVITAEQGRAIADFVRAHSDAEKIICQCEAGISRSAAVAAAILKANGQDDMPIFNSLLYLPNMLVFRTVLRALMETENVEIACGHSD